MITWQILLPFIPPAVAVSILAYFVRFFGKAIADQTPYADNRDWEAELSGLFFLIDFLFPPAVIAGAILLYFKGPIMVWFDQVSVLFAPITYHWVNLVIVFLVWIYYVSASRVLTKWKYKIPDNPSEPKNLDITNDERKKKFGLVVNVNAVLLQPSAMLLIFIFGIEVLSGSVLWMTIFATQLFIAFIGLALNYSLMRYHLPTVNIHFTNKKSILRDVTLLKVNPDNIRIRDAERVLVINKSILSEIEFIDAKQRPEVNRSMVPFTLWIPWLLALYSFWKNNLWLGLFISIVIPLIFFAIALTILGTQKSTPKVTPKFNNFDEFGEWIFSFIKSLPFLTKAAYLGTVIDLVASIFGAIGAWHHNINQVIVLGVIVPFITWAFWQIVGVASLATTHNLAERSKTKE